MSEVKLPKIDSLKEEIKTFKRNWDIEYALYCVFGEPEWLVNMLGGSLPPNKPFKELSIDEFLHSFNYYLREK